MISGTRHYGRPGEKHAGDGGHEDIQLKEQNRSDLYNGKDFFEEKNPRHSYTPFEQVT
jgi:hypothetical protein